MALLFCDSADHYTTVAQKYPAGASGWSIGAGLGRFATSALVCGGSSGTKSFNVAISPAKGTLIIGFAYLHITAVGARTFLVLLDGATTHVTLTVGSDGKFNITRAGTVLATGTTIMSADRYYWLELRVKIGDTDGEYELRVDGATEIGPTTGADTRNAAAAQITTVQWQSPGNITGGSRVDDIYICDTLGGAADTFLGEVRVQALFPNANGASSGFVGNDGNSVDNYLLVDEAAPDSDTTYVEANVVGTKDTYNYGALSPGAGTVYGVQVLPFAYKTDAGVRQIVSVARESGGTEEDSAAKTLAAAYGYLPDIRMTKPGGGAWTIADVNAAEFGVKVSA